MIKIYNTITIIFVIFYTSGCISGDDKTRNNDVDIKFELNFNNCIQIIAYRRSGFGIDLDVVYNAVECLNAVTQINSSILKYGDIPYIYPNDQLFMKDVVNWSNWYNRNKFKMNAQIADSLIQKHSEKIGDTINWPKMCYELILENKISIVK